MKTRILIVSVMGFIALPSCMNTAGRLSSIRDRQHQVELEATGTVARGACDDIGQYIAGDVMASRLTLDVTPQVTQAWTK
jgi:hypothetical protein